jgi:hypothetical protein
MQPFSVDQASPFLNALCETVAGTEVECGGVIGEGGDASQTDGVSQHLLKLGPFFLNSVISYSSFPQ